MKVTLLAHSVYAGGKPIATFELEYPRIILAELNTHGMLCKNSMSSRAVPAKKMIEQVRNDPAKPVRFGANQAGMQDSGGDHDALILDLYNADEWWKAWAEANCIYAESMAEAGYHKQVVNRPLEAFQMMKTVVSATEWNNFFWLRNDEDADPTFKQLAQMMQETLESSTPVVLEEGDWHTPYFKDGYWKPSMKESLEDALAISSSCCAQVSYRVLDDSLEKAQDIYCKLLTGRKVHASPFQHQATPMPQIIDELEEWPEGVTHVDRYGDYWSAQFNGWIMHRQLLNNHVMRG